MELPKPAPDARVVLWVPYDGRLQRQDVTRMLATSAPQELSDSTNLKVKFSRKLDHVFVEVVLENETIANQVLGTKIKPQLELVSTKESHLRRQRIRKIFTEIKSGDFKLTRCKVTGCRVFFHRREDAFRHTLKEHLKDATIRFTSHEKRAYSGEWRTMFPSRSQHPPSWLGNSKDPNYLSTFCAQHTTNFESSCATGFGQDIWSLIDSQSVLDFTNAIEVASKLQNSHLMEPFQLIDLADVSGRGITEPCEWTWEKTDAGYQKKTFGFVTEDDDLTTVSTPCGTSPSSSGEGSSPEEFSDDEDLGRMDDLEMQKALMVTRLLLRIHHMFATQGDSTRGRNTGSGSPVSKSQQHSNRSGSFSGQSRQTGVKRGRSCGDNGENDDQNNKRQRDRATLLPPDGDNGKRLACPFFKNNPHGKYSSRACYGPGWKSVHRLKEHLYREHLMPIHCPRCCTTFRDETKLAEHSREPEPCQIRRAISFAGLNKEQTAKLKCRKGIYGETEERKKWEFVYLILFPDTSLNGIPSAYYEPTDSNPIESIQSSPMCLSDNTEFAYLQQELPRKIRRVLEAKVENWIGPIEDLLHHQIEDIVSECLNSTQSDFKGHPYLEASSAEQTEFLITDTADSASMWYEESDFSSVQLDQHTRHPLTPPNNELPTTGESGGDPLSDPFPWDGDQALTELGIFATPFFDDFEPVFSQNGSAKSAQQTLNPDSFLDLDLTFAR